MKERFKKHLAKSCAFKQRPASKNLFADTFYSRPHHTTTSSGASDADSCRSPILHSKTSVVEHLQNDESTNPKTCVSSPEDVTACLGCGVSRAGAGERVEGGRQGASTDAATSFKNEGKFEKKAQQACHDRNAINDRTGCQGNGKEKAVREEGAGRGNPTMMSSHNAAADLSRRDGRQGSAAATVATAEGWLAGRGTKRRVSGEGGGKVSRVCGKDKDKQEEWERHRERILLAEVDRLMPEQLLQEGPTEKAATATPTVMCGRVYRGSEEKAELAQSGRGASGGAATIASRAQRAPAASGKCVTSHMPVLYSGNYSLSGGQEGRTEKKREAGKDRGVRGGPAGAGTQKERGMLERLEEVDLQKKRWGGGEREAGREAGREREKERNRLICRGERKRGGKRERAN
jgi:hypothetical protein